MFMATATKKNRNFAFRLLRKVIPYKKQVIFLILVTVLTSLLNAAPPLLLQYAIDHYILGKDLPGLALILVAYIVLGACIAISWYFQRKISQYLGSNVVRHIRNDLFEHITYLSFSYFDTTSTGDLMARVTSDTEELTALVNAIMSTFTVNIITLTWILGVMFAWNLIFGLIFLGLFPFILIELKYFTKKFMPARRQVRHTNGQLTSSAQECFNGIREIKLFGREEFMGNSFKRWNDDYFDAVIQTTKYRSLLRPYMPTILSVFSVIFIVIGSNLVIGNMLTLGEMIAAITYFSMIGGRLYGFIDFNIIYNSAKTAAERVFEVLDKIPSIKDAPDAVALVNVRGAVEFREVHFGYDPQNEILKGISLEVNPGEIIALVGPSGVGKTSLIHLIPRFYEASQGEVLVDGLNVNHYKLESLRRNVGIVMQNVFLFDGTIAQNITYGQPDATLQEIQEATRVAQFDDFIQELPLKYDTPIGERGIRLSGGQAQRLSIARVLITNPKILIMDEPTAQVDAITDQKLMQAVRRVMEGRTTILIAHRLWTIKNADRIVLLKEGKIEATGNHEELTSTCAFYREFFASQFLSSNDKEQDPAGGSKVDMACVEGKESEKPGQVERSQKVSGPAQGQQREQEKGDEEEAIEGSSMQFLYPYLRPYRWPIVQCIFWTLVTTVAGLIPPLLLMTILDRYIPDANMDAIFQYTMILIGLYAGTYFARAAQNWVTEVTTQQITRNLRESILRQLMGGSMAYFGERKRGELVSVVTNDVSRLSQAVSTGLSNLFSTAFSLVFLLLIMLLLDWQLGLVISLCVPIMMICIQQLRNRIWRIDLEIQKKVAQMTANVEENISGVRVTQSLAMERRSVKGFNQVTKQLQELRMKVIKMFAKVNAIVSNFLYILMAIMICFGGYRYITGGVSIGVIVALIQYTNQIGGPINDVAVLSDTFINASTALHHIRENVATLEVIPDPDNPILLPSEVRGEIVLDHVRFSYTDQPLYEDFSITIADGEKLGVVGETGAGKTTLINLITRLYDVKGGSVRIDGIDVRSIRQTDLRSLIAMVSQNVFLFSDTIFNNIKFGRPTALDEEVYAAARLAHADPFIQHLPQGYETKLGDQGAGISSGQRQLLAYARILLANPKIAILDEATSNIDSYTETLIQQNMGTALQGITVIIIAHRFATLQRVDRIAILRNGTIEAEGTHEDLLESNAYYYDLCEKQCSRQ